MALAAAGKDHKALRRVAKALITKASDGDVSAIKEIGDRLDGRPTQATEISGPAGEPIQLEETPLTDAERIRALAALIARTKSEKSQND
jgi:hypothetical protein